MSVSAGPEGARVTASSLGERRPISNTPWIIHSVILAKAHHSFGASLMWEALYIFNANEIPHSYKWDIIFYPYFPEKETGSERLSYLLGFSYQGLFASTAYALNPSDPGAAPTG